MEIPFDNSYARLPSRFHAEVAPSTAQAPRLIKLNENLATELGLDPEWLQSAEGTAFLSGERLAQGSQPIALAYAGHQFGHFVPQLGDGRAILLGELIDRYGQRRDIQLKGAGLTPFSRTADGKAALGPVLREYLVSEAMAALGVPTTRALAASLTGQQVLRETALPGAVIARVAASHIRVGTFQYFAARGDTEAVQLLADYVIARHYPHLAGGDHRYRGLLAAVADAQADLIARWLSIGFIHGVMNTDNMAVSGETIDYGPCAFMDAYDPGAVFSSIDRQGRYAYANQPQIALWNLTRLAETLLPLLDADTQNAVAQAEDVLGGFVTRFQSAYLRAFRAKLGLTEAQDADGELIEALLGAMARGQVDFTLLFRRLSGAVEPYADAQVRALFEIDDELVEWLPRWRARLAQEAIEPAAREAAMDAVNPAFIPRNHRVEAMIAAAVERNDFAPFEELLQVLSRPYEDQSAFSRYQDPPAAEERVVATFCGT